MTRTLLALALTALAGVVLLHVRRGDPGAVQIAVANAVLRTVTRRTR